MSKYKSHKLVLIFFRYQEKKNFLTKQMRATAGDSYKKFTLELQTGHLQRRKLVPSFYFTTKHVAAEIILDLLKQW